MGGSDSKNIQEQAFISEHPFLNDAKLLTSKEDGSKTIQANFKVQNDQYDEWHKLLEVGPSKLQSDYLLLPERTNYKHDQGLCGNTGTLTVSSSPLRTHILTTPILLQNSSANANPTVASSRRVNYGMCCSPSQPPRMT